MASRLENLFQDYERFHQTRGNRVCHLLGIPVIVISIFGLLSNAHPPWNAGLALWAVASAFYLVLNWKLAIPFDLALYGAMILGRTLSPLANLSLFILGWATQFIGHWFFEKNSPAFFKNFLHLLIGPFWIFAKTIRYRTG